MVTGPTNEEHLINLRSVFDRLEKAGLRIQCEFMKPSVTYLGHKIDEQGLHPVAEKAEALILMSVQELKSYLGLLTYYRKFYPRMSDNGIVVVPLYRLLQKDQQWVLGEEQQRAFDSSKSVLT